MSKVIMLSIIFNQIIEFKNGNISDSFLKCKELIYNSVVTGIFFQNIKGRI